MRKHYPLNALGVEDAGQLPWSDGVPATGTEGSYPGHAIITDAETEILNAQGLAGLSPSGSDLSQLGQAIARGIYLGGFSGSANALSASLPNSVVVQQIQRGMRFTGYTSVANTAGVTVTIRGFAQAPGTQSLLRRDGAALQSGDLPVGADFDFRFDGSAYRLVGVTPSEIAALIPPAPSAPTYPAVALWHVGTAGGTASAVTVSDLAPAITSYADKLPIFLVFPNGIADGASVNIAGLGTIPIQRNDGSPIQRGDIPVNGPALFNLYGTGALRLASFGRAEIQRIVVNPTLYVRPGGSDSNDGSANTDAKAFQTIAAAVAAGTNQFNFASSTLTIQLGTPGTYAAPTTDIPRGSGTISIVGDPANQGSYIITGAGTAGRGLFQAVSAVVGIGFTLQVTGGQGHLAVSTPGGVMILQNVTLAATGTTNGFHVFGSGGSITLASGCIIQGNSSGALWADGGTGIVSVNTGTVLTIQGTPTFSTATAYATNAGHVNILSGGSVSGSANGPRYLGSGYGNINTGGIGPNAFPGSSAGSVSNALYQ